MTRLTLRGRLIRTGIAGVSTALCVGAVAAGVGANSANADDRSHSKDAVYAKRDEGNANVVLVADDDDDEDDLTGARVADRSKNTKSKNTKSKKSKNTRSKNSRGTKHSRNSKKSRDNTRSNFTKVSRDGEPSRGDKTRDWTRDGGDKTRDHSKNHTNDRSRNDTRR